MTHFQKFSSPRSRTSTVLLVALLFSSLQSFANRNANAGAIDPFFQFSSLPVLDSRLPGKWVQGSYKNQFGSRDYYLYVPQNGQAGPLPLVIALHGCEEDAVSFATQTGLREIGEKYGFAVLFPQEAQQDNMMKCWNWFKPENQARDSGELSIVVGMMGQVNGQIQIDKNRIFVGGISAGGAMAANLLACYSDLFAGGLIHSGLEFEASTSDVDAYQAMISGSSTDPISSAADAVRCSGSAAKLETVLIIHGSQDTTVNPINSKLALRQFNQMNDLLDDGSANGSQKTTPIDTSHLTAPGGDTYDMDSYGGLGGIHIVNVTVNGMGHAWSGAHQAGQFADPKGPDAGEMMWQFLSQNSHRP